VQAFEDFLVFFALDRFHSPASKWDEASLRELPVEVTRCRVREGSRTRRLEVSASEPQRFSIQSAMRLFRQAVVGVRWRSPPTYRSIEGHRP
jgi:hypothetical protein